MNVLAMASQKGGVGKTTVALNLALAFARRGWNTLLVDGDPQGSIGLSIRGSTRNRAGLVECLEGDEALDAALVATRLSNLHILAVGRPTADRPQRWSKVFSEGTRFASFVEHLRSSGAYDLVLVDCPSGLYGPTLQILGSVDSVLVPIQAEPLALRSVTQALEAVGYLRDQGGELTLAGFLVTMFNSRQEVSLQVTQEVWSQLPSDMVLEAVVPRDEAFLNASAQGVPLGLISRRPPPVATVFEQIAAELEPRLGLLQETDDDGPISLVD